MKETTVPTLFSKFNIGFLITLTVLIFGVLHLSGNLDVGPRMADENQIFKQQFELEEFGFMETLSRELSSRFKMKRLVPVYCIQKVVLSKVFGTNIFLWSIYAGILSVISGFLLFYIGRLLNFGVLASVFLSLITIIGEQSVLWWRILQGESIGLLWFSVGLVMLIVGYKKYNKKLEYGSILAFILASISKESFILMLPAVGIFRLALPIFYDQKFEWQKELKKNLPFLIALGGSCIALIGIIKYGLGTTSFQYTGWRGFNAEQFSRILTQFAEITNLKYFILFPILFGVLIKLEWKKITDNTQLISNKIWLAIAMLIVISLPQLLLYMSSGFYNFQAEANYTRYLVPCMLGLSFLIALFVDILQKSATVKFYALILAAIVVFQLMDKLSDAYKESVEYGMHSKYITQWFDTISNNVPTDENVTIVFLNGAQGGYSLQAALRVFYILSKGHDYENVYFTPFPKQPTFEEQYPNIVQRDTKYHSKKMRTTNEIKGKESLGGVMILNWGALKNIKGTVASELEKAFIQENRGWFNPNKYRRVVNRNGHISYYIK